MLSEERVVKALEAMGPARERYRAAVTHAAEEVRALLAARGAPAEARCCPAGAGRAARRSLPA